MPDGTFKRLQLLGPGDYVGKPDLFGRAHYPASARVITDSILQELQSSDLRSLMEQNTRSASSAAENEVRVEPVPSDITVSHTGRVVVAFSFSRRLPKNALVESLARTLFAETAESVLLLRLVPAEKAPSGGTLLSLDGIIDSDFHLLACLPKANGSVARLDLRVTNKAHEAESVAPLLSNLSRHFDYVLVQADMDDLSAPPLPQFIIQADASYLFIHPNSEDLHAFESFIDDLRVEARGNCSEINPVICLAENQSVNDELKLKNNCPSTFIHDCPSSDSGYSGPGAMPPAFARDVRRLAREIGSCRIGLALSAGGAKGLAHIGVIQVLEENGIEVDMIAGCSMGAYVAAVWAAGCDGAMQEKLAREVEGRWGLLKLLDPVLLPRRGFILGEAVTRRLKRTIGNMHFSDMVRPLRVVATDLSSLERVIFSSGEVARAVHASCAIPGVCVPATIGDETYIDGGMSDPMPVDVLSEMGIDRIIAVNAIPPTAFLRCCREKEKEDTEILRKKVNVFSLLNRQFNFLAEGNILDIMMRALYGAQTCVAEQACRHASVVLRPLSVDAHWHDFNHPGKYIEMGRQVALQQLDKLKALARRKVSRHEHRSADNSVAGLA